MPVLFLVGVSVILFAFYTPSLIRERRAVKPFTYEYDPTGEYTYKHQNPKFKENHE